MRIIFIGLMLFALFFGAGNLIFPAQSGQLSGEHFGIASFGFVITGVIMPLLGVIALGFSGEKDFLKITQRSGKTFGIIFATVLYLTIGPLFAMPRTGSVSYEMTIRPFVEDHHHLLFLAIFTILYFGISCILAINPAKIVDIVGKILTPLMLLFIVILIASAFITPMGHIQPPKTDAYNTTPFFTGFTNGYLTMDTLASLIFGIIVVNSIMGYGIKNKTQIMKSCIKSSLIAAAILALVYVSLFYLGATSVENLGILENGALVLAHISQYYFGVWGNLILGIIVTMACLTTNIGLTNACANYMLSLFPQLSYRTYAIIFSIISGLFANVGLSALISFSVPVLSIIYPATIVLIVLIFAHKLFNGYQIVYRCAIYCALIVSAVYTILATLKELPQTAQFYQNFLAGFDKFLENSLPLYNVGIGWLFPTILAAVVGYIIARLMHTKQLPI